MLHGAPGSVPVGAHGGPHIVMQTVLVPPQVMGYVLGRRGRTIRDIAATTGCDVHIDDTVAGRALAVIRGEASGAAAAVARIHGILNVALSTGPVSAPAFTRLIPLSFDEVGAVIGRGGDVIRGIAATTGAAVRVVRRGAGRQFVEISATDESSCAAAVSAVEVARTTAGAPMAPYSGRDDAPSGALDAAPHWGGAPHAGPPLQVRAPAGVAARVGVGAGARSQGELAPAARPASAGGGSLVIGVSPPASSPSEACETPSSSATGNPAVMSSRAAGDSPVAVAPHALEHAGGSASGAADAAVVGGAGGVLAHGTTSGLGGDGAGSGSGGGDNTARAPGSGADAPRGTARSGGGVVRDPAIVEAARVARDAAAAAAPLHRTLTLSHPTLLGVVLGRGGSAVQTIARATGTVVTVDKRLGLVHVHGPHLAALDAASRAIDARLVAHFAADGAPLLPPPHHRGGGARPAAMPLPPPPGPFVGPNFNTKAGVAGPPRPPLRPAAYPPPGADGSDPQAYRSHRDYAGAPTHGGHGR